MTRASRPESPSSPPAADACSASTAARQDAAPSARQLSASGTHCRGDACAPARHDQRVNAHVCGRGMADRMAATPPYPRQMTPRGLQRLAARCTLQSTCRPAPGEHSLAPAPARQRQAYRLSHGRTQPAPTHAGLHPELREHAAAPCAQPRSMRAAAHAQQRAGTLCAAQAGCARAAAARAARR